MLSASRVKSSAAMLSAVHLVRSDENGPSTDRRFSMQPDLVTLSTVPTRNPTSTATSHAAVFRSVDQREQSGGQGAPWAAPPPLLQAPTCERAVARRWRRHFVHKTNVIFFANSGSSAGAFRYAQTHHAPALEAEENVMLSPSSFSCVDGPLRERSAPQNGLSAAKQKRE